MSDIGESDGSLIGWAILAILGFAIYGAFSAFKNLNHPKAPDYSASHFRGTQEIAPLPANPRRLTLTLRTSWIPGDQKTGILRYVVGISPSQSIDADTDSIFLGRISMCAISIDMLDKQGFKVSTIPVKMVKIIDSNQDVTALSDSDFIPMSREGYEALTDT